MGLSIREGLDIAEREAWRGVGAKNRGWFTWGKRLTPVALVGSALGAVGYGLYRAYHAVAGWLSGPETVSVSSAAPGALWIAAVVLIVVTAVAIRLAGRAVRFAPVAAGSVVLILAWLGVIGYAIGRLG